MAGRNQKNSKRDWSRPKILLVFCIFILTWMGLWGRAFFVQIIQGEELAAMADRQYFSREKITGKRGEIFDRNRAVLAQSVRSKSVYVNPFLVESPGEASVELAAALEMDSSRVMRLLNQQSRFVWVRRKVSDRTAHAVAELNLPGVFIIDEHARVYPRGHMLGQVLGFVGIDNQGLEGLEKSFNERLSGAEVIIVMQRDASGHKMSLLPQDPTREVDGKDLVLTIDSQIQFAAEKSLASAVETHGGTYGIALVVHVPTGDILAWASYPFFNPNNFQESSSSVWRNRAAVDLFEPGSTFKPFLMAAVLEEGVARSDSLYFCENGRWRLGRNEIKDVKGYGWLTLNRVLRYSSNICSAKIGLDLGPGPYFKYLDMLGLTSGVDLPLPGQARGILRAPHQWTRIDLAAISFGQGLAMTPLQLARAYLTLGNHGVFTELNIIHDGARVPRTGQRVFSREVSMEVLAMLRDAVERDGTGTRARISGVEAGGKTGTAQKASPSGGYGDKYVASFVGFIPALEPEYMIMVIIDEPSPQHYGGIVAAPVFAEIGGGILSSGRGLRLRSIAHDQARRVQKTYSEDNAGPWINHSSEITFSEGQVPDLRGTSLRQAMESLLRAGVVPELKGRGVMVRDQNPGPGQDWNHNNESFVLHLGCS